MGSRTGRYSHTRGLCHRLNGVHNRPPVHGAFCHPRGTEGHGRGQGHRGLGQDTPCQVVQEGNGYIMNATDGITISPPSWDLKIERCKVLAERYTFAREILDFYLKLLTFQKGLYEEDRGNKEAFTIEKVGHPPQADDVP